MKIRHLVLLIILAVVLYKFVWPMLEDRGMVGGGKAKGGKANARQTVRGQQTG